MVKNTDIRSIFDDMYVLFTNHAIVRMLEYGMSRGAFFNLFNNGFEIEYDGKDRQRRLDNESGKLKYIRSGAWLFILGKKKNKGNTYKLITIYNYEEFLQLKNR